MNEGLLTDEERFFRRIYFTDSCWLWTGRTKKGWGSCRWQGKKDSAPHRVMYEHVVGPIPPGYTIDHLCMVRNCVNPSHLEAVTPQVNSWRAHVAKLHRQGVLP